jgi:hypothetical protein
VDDGGNSTGNLWAWFCCLYTLISFSTRFFFVVFWLIFRFIYAQKTCILSAAAVFIILLIVKRRNGQRLLSLIVVPARKASKQQICSSNSKSVRPVQYIPLFRLYENGQNLLK